VVGNVANPKISSIAGEYVIHGLDEFNLESTPGHRFLTPDEIHAAIELSKNDAFIKQVLSAVKKALRNPVYIDQSTYKYVIFCFYHFTVNISIRNVH
jgi:hypothetical protein